MEPSREVMRKRMLGPEKLAPARLMRAFPAGYFISVMSIGDAVSSEHSAASTHFGIAYEFEFVSEEPSIRSAEAKLAASSA